MSENKLTTPIESLGLEGSNLGGSINDRFEAINDNFEKILSSSFLKGDNGENICVKPIILDSSSTEEIGYIAGVLYTVADLYENICDKISPIWQRKVIPSASLLV